MTKEALSLNDPFHDRVAKVAKRDCARFSNKSALILPNYARRLRSPRPAARKVDLAATRPKFLGKHIFSPRFTTAP